MKTDQINKFIHSHTATMLLSIVAVCGIIASFFLSPTTSESLLPSGLGLPEAYTWFDIRGVAFGINLVASIGIAFVLYILNQEFKLMRDKSDAIAGLFMIMQMAMPQAMLTFSGGTLMTLVLLTCTFMLFTIYNVTDCSLVVYTIFMLIGLGSLTFYGYLFFVPLFIIGCMQVRVFSTRTLVAAILGLLTFPWILTGFGIVDPATIAMPDIDTALTALEQPEKFIDLLSSTGLSILICLLCGAGCVMRSYNYNSQSRAYNGFIYLMTLGTILLICVDFNAVYLYLPLLNCAAAYQAGHFFITNQNPHSFIGVMLILMSYMALYIWNIL